MECANKNAKFDITETWLGNVAYSHSGSESTRYHYKKHFSMFCEYIGKTPEEIMAEYEDAELKRVPERTLRRRYSQYLQGWIVALEREGYASGTIFIMVAAVQSFFKYNDLGMGHVPIGKLKVTFHNRDLTKQDIIEIIKASNPREKAFYLVMAQSGLRPHTVSALRYKHIQLDFEKHVIPCKIEVPSDLTKGKYRSYFTFIGEDAVKALETYFNIDKEGKMQSDSLIFSKKGHDEEPLDRRIISHYFHDTVTVLNEKGVVDYEQKELSKPGTVRLYGLRKWFRKQAAQAGSDYVNFWMGHTLKNPSDNRYFKPDEGNVKKFSEETVEHHRQIFAEKAAPYLRLETAAPNETERVIKEQKQRIEQLEKELAEIKKTRPALETLLKRVEEIERKLASS
jgi:integrase